MQKWTKLLPPWIQSVGNAQHDGAVSVAQRESLHITLMMVLVLITSELNTFKTLPVIERPEAGEPWPLSTVPYSSVRSPMNPHTLHFNQRIWCHVTCTFPSPAPLLARMRSERRRSFTRHGGARRVRSNNHRPPRVILFRRRFSSACSAVVFLACGITLRRPAQMFQSAATSPSCCVLWLNAPGDKWSCSSVFIGVSSPTAWIPTADLHVLPYCTHAGLPLLTFPLGLSHIDRCSRWLVVVTSRECSHPTRN